MSEAASEISGLKEQEAGTPVASHGMLAWLRARRMRNRARAEAQRMFVAENQTARALQIERKDTTGSNADALLLPPFGRAT
jgi:hypothetical protein